MKTPKITILTAVKNCRDAIEDTIKNVSEIAYRPLDFIVVDGQSTDGTRDIIERYRDRIDYLICETDAGLYEALNKGWHIADPDSYVIVLGAGDKILKLPEFELTNYKNRIICGSVQIGMRKTFISRVDFTTRFRNTLHHQALLIPKKIHPNPPFNTKFKFYADFEFNQRLLKSGVRFTYSNQFCSFALPNGISDDYSFEAIRISNENYGFLYASLAFLFYLYQKVKRLAIRS